MCGIAGIYAHGEGAPPVDSDELLRIREAMRRRGPDGEGLWVSGNRRIGLAHRRLAIIDLTDAGAQPMASADGRLRITFNGEIYNYRELREQLEAKGHEFRSGSDTEVLLNLYADRGPELVHSIRGMYAFAIWDETDQELFLARDPLGIKPLYYAEGGGTFRFASLVAALMQGGQVDGAEDAAGVAGFYLLGCVPDPFTFYRAVRSLPAGHTMRVRRSGPRKPEEYFSLNAEFLKAEAAPAAATHGEMRERILGTLGDSMRHHMVSDVPVGLFLSAGADSSALATLGAQLAPGKLHALTLGFREYRGTPNDETAEAERTAKELSITHATKWIEHDDFRGEWGNFLAAMDQPSTDGANTFLVARAAAQSGLKVAISGLGGDELFGGYPSFADVPRMQRWIPRAPLAGRAVRALSDPLLRAFTSPKFAGLLEYGSSHAGAYLLRRALHMPWELRRLMGRRRAEAALEVLRPLESFEKTIRGLRNPRCIVAALELSWYMRNQLLRDSDWAGMFHGVEIRVPFVDVAMIRAMAPMMAGTTPPTKRLLISAVSPSIASAVASRAKTGFMAPVREWMNAELPALQRERGLRGWSRMVGKLKGGGRYLALVTDGFGGHGGIALYSRDLLKAVCGMPGCAEMVAIPRHMPNPAEPMPRNLVYVSKAVSGKVGYLAATLREFRDGRSYDLVVCGHINLLPLAWFASRVLGVPLVLFIYGVDAWQPARSLLSNALARRVRWIVSISETTAGKFRSWGGSPAQRLTVLPNAIHRDWYGTGPKDRALLERYGLQDKVVLMTLGRLVSAERYKGFDEVIDLLPALSRRVPQIAYLIVGDGSDRKRLQDKVAALGLSDRVKFAGNIPESEKAAHYRLADAYVMASRGEGFGFVLLEAMACGIPVVASCLDGGREAIRNGELGILVDPTDVTALETAILEALASPKGAVPAGLEHFSFQNFEMRAHTLFRQVLAEAPHHYGG